MEPAVSSLKTLRALIIFLFSHTDTSFLTWPQTNEGCSCHVNIQKHGKTLLMLSTASQSTQIPQVTYWNTAFFWGGGENRNLEHPDWDPQKSGAAHWSLSSFTSSALLQCTLTIVRLGMISLFVLFISWLAVVDRWQCGAFGLSEFMKAPSTIPPSLPSSSLVSCMKLASCPGQGLCLSHARLDPRHFIALTLPPTVTAALNETTHMCLDQVGQEPGVQLNDIGLDIFNRSMPVFSEPCVDSQMSVSCFFFF